MSNWAMNALTLESHALRMAVFHVDKAGFYQHDSEANSRFSLRASDGPWPGRAHLAPRMGISAGWAEKEMDE